MGTIRVSAQPKQNIAYKKDIQMNTRNKTLIFFVVAIMLAIQVAPVSAQDNTPPLPNQLTQFQMKNAVVVSDGSATNRSKVKGDVYRLAGCDGSKPDAPCYFVITGSGNFTENASNPSIAPLAASATITCGINVYNGIGANVARLQQNVNVTFWGTYGQTPVTLNWGDLRGTSALPGYSWSGLTGPNPNPSWGVYVTRAGTAYSTAGGTLSFNPPVLPPLQTYVSSRLTIRSTGWSCS